MKSAPQLSWGQPANYTPTFKFSAVAQIFPTTNNTMHGRISFTQVYSDKQVMIEVDLSGAAPNSVHGLHLHTFGDTSDKLAMKMGGHFNPFNGTHGCSAVAAVEQDDRGRSMYTLPETNPFHVGDFGSLTFDGNGAASAVYFSSQLSLWDSSAASFLMGHGFVVHAMPDDCKTQPTGNSSVRLGQGVIAFGSRDAYIKPQSPASANLGIAYFDGVNGVEGSIVAQGAGDFSFNLTGLPKGKITFMTTMSGDATAIETSAICSDETDFDLSKRASKIASLTADDNGSIIQTVVVAAPHESLSVVEMLGRGVLIVAGSCANVLAMAPMGIKFVDPPKSTTATTSTTATSSATATISDQTTQTGFVSSVSVSSESTQASLSAASATSNYNPAQAPQYSASVKPMPAGPGSANLYASSAARSLFAALVPLLCAYAYLLV
ncbi:superoxide dismutase [Chytriomyces cf. hyalinus JEL632]|nr:superoxide dismutase [Chytriomyces cf. hyalinus JEL632]